MRQIVKKMEEKKYVTLDEMYEIFKGDAYKDFRSFYGMELDSDPAHLWKVPTLHVWCHRDLPLLYRHIIAEQLLIADYHDIPWSDFGAYDRIVFLDMMMLWMNPLSWVNPLEIEDYVVDSRIAQEVFDEPRFYDEIVDVFRHIEISRTLSFADNPRVCEGDYSSQGIVKGMHYWYDLTMDYTDPMCRIFRNGECLSHEEMHKTITMYHAPSLRNRLMIIADNRGEKRAAELLRMLQAEWPKLKLWKTEMERMTDEQISEFESILFNGFDELLEAWEKDKEEEEVVASSKGKPESSFFAVSEKMSYEMCEKELIRVINGAKNKAAACREILRSETIGYFVLSDKTDQEKADAINPWVALTDKKYKFTGDDFRKARNS